VDQYSRIVVTSCFGSYWGSCKRWVEHTRFKCNLPIHILSIDGRHLTDDFGEEVFVHPVKVTSEDVLDAELHRLEFIVDRLGSGISCAQIDLDVLLKRDIADLFTIDADFIASQAFGLPEFMASRFGFVACLGFFIAKPPSAMLCAEIVKAMQESRYGEEHPRRIDQYILNKLVFDQIVSGEMKPFTETSPSGVPFGEPYRSSEYRGIKVCVLARDTILRGPNLAQSTFGNHFPGVLSLFDAG
jgi:hypothetical protein